MRSSKSLKTTVELTFTTQKATLVVHQLLVLFSTGNTLFWVNLVRKLKIVSLRWKVILRLIRIWRIQWWCSVFLFLTRSILFLEICSKIVCWSWNLEPRFIRICAIQCLFSYFLDQNFRNSFCINLVQQFKSVSLRRNSLTRLIWRCKILWWCSLFLF